jgi:thioredoxin 1
MNREVATFPVMVTLYDFTAKWCGPCRVMDPVLASIEKEYGSRVRIEKIDVDEDQLRTQQYNVRSMPTFVLVRDGREVGRAIGSRPRAFLVGMIDRALNGDVAITAP